MVIYGSEASVIRSVDPLPVGQLIHIAGTLDDASGLQMLYIDDTPVAAAITKVRPFGELDPAEYPGLGIGSLQVAFGDKHGAFNGTIAEVRISDVALNPGEFIPEPATLSLLAIGACLPLLRKRSR